MDNRQNSYEGSKAVVGDCDSSVPAKIPKASVAAAFELSSLTECRNLV